MIQLKPKIQITIECSACNNTFAAAQWHITGMHTVVEGKCNQCSNVYYREAPINAGLFYPGIIDAAKQKRADRMPFDNWYLSGLLDSYKNRREKKIEFNIEIKKSTNTNKVLLLNTIDQTYGHALFELFNASYYLKLAGYDLIVIVQKKMRWLVPEGVSQIWTLDIPFSEAKNWNPWVANKISELLADKEQVYICRSFVQADLTEFNIEDYTRIKPFPLDAWDEKIKSGPTVTFICRPDKFWKKMLPQSWDNRLTKKCLPGIFKKIELDLQHQWVLNFAKELKNEIPSLDFALAGLENRNRKIPKWIKDFRYAEHDDLTAAEQCKRYSESHIVLGCNGSSLILPGCHAGAVVNIVPGDQWAVSAGSFPFRFTSIGDTHYRYVMLPPEVTIKRLASIVIAILRDRSLIELHTSFPWRDHRSNLQNYDWAQERMRSYALTKYFKSKKGLVTTNLAGSYSGDRSLD